MAGLEIILGCLALLGNAGGARAGRLHGFGPALFRGLALDAGATVSRLVGDFDGDGLTDLAVVRKSVFGFDDGAVLVQLNEGGSFGPGATWHSNFATGSEIILAGDANGDGRDDLFAFTRGSSGDVWVALSTGSGFGAKTKWHDSFCFGSDVPLVGDVNGDGRDDVIACTRGTSANVYVATSTGSSFSGNGWLWNGNFCPGTAVPKTGDVNGDGRDDLLAFYRNSQTGAAQGDVMVAIASYSNSFGTAQKWHDWFSIGDELPVVADVDADGLDDVLTFTRGSDPRLFVALNSGSAFVGTGDLWHGNLCQSGQEPWPGRFNRDGNDDVVCLPSGGSGTITLSLAGGHAEAIPASTADFGYGTMGVPYAQPELASRPSQVKIPVLAVLVEVPGKPTFASKSRPPAFWDQWLFGPGDPSVVNYYLEMSGGKLLFTKAGLVGPLPIDPSTAPGNDIRNFIKQKLHDNGFDFRPFDRNGDKIIDNNELVILQIDNSSDAGGQTVKPWETVDHDGTPIEIRSSVAASGYLGRFDLHAHELSHTLGTIDLYSSGCYAQWLSLMNCNANTGNVAAMHLDGYHKMRLGWVRPNTYDLRYPGGAFVANAQLSARTPSQPPVILYDPRRGTNEYYLAEFRTRTWTSGAAVLPTGAPAGYDSSTSGNGVALWYFDTEEGNHDPVIRRSAIRPGANGTLETGVWPGSDDVVKTVPAPGIGFTSDRFYTTFLDPGPDGIMQSDPPYIILPGPNGTLESGVASGSDDVVSGNQILRGPDNRLQSQVAPGSDDLLSLDDRLSWDRMAFPSTTPSDFVSRRNNTLIRKSDGATEPQWFDNSQIGPEVRVDEYGTTSPVAFVEWGSPFVPWLEQAQSGALVAGAPFFLDGTLGIRGTDGPVPVVISGNGTVFDMEVMTWSGTRATLRMPIMVPDGAARLVVYADSGRTIESNSLPITVDNRYYAYINAELGQLVNGDLAQLDPLFDFDRDGLPNFGEFLLGTGAASFDSGLPIDLTLVPGQGADIRWSELNGQEQYGRVVAQISEDLQGWDELPPDSTWKIDERLYHSAFRPLQPRAFVRLVFKLPGEP